jgi:hypothetical protein
MQKFICTLLFLVATTLSATAAGQTGTLAPGEYLSERGWGQLVVKREPNARLTFAIEALGGNMHSCSLEGEIRNGRATLEGDEKDNACVVSFTAKGADIEVKPNTSCRMYCGARAGFDAVYHRPAPGCGRAAMRRTRDEFKRLYDRKAYAEARAKIEPLVTGCGKTTWWLDDGWLRNDLAITLYRLGDLEGCKRVLANLAEDAAKTDKDVLESFPPSDGESYLPIVRAARANLKVCSAPARKP